MRKQLSAEFASGFNAYVGNIFGALPHSGQKILGKRSAVSEEPFHWLVQAGISSGPPDREHVGDITCLASHGTEQLPPDIFGTVGRNATVKKYRCDISESAFFIYDSLKCL
ncbi:hypothetical protein [Candidatus Poriferisocius sp.]|uniref:hypothetical protein n=1 Tax=Candidatus Poriferisocius sp. TaxID=3101276 RepID=UPI003B010679